LVPRELFRAQPEINIAVAVAVGVAIPGFVVLYAASWRVGVVWLCLAVVLGGVLFFSLVLGLREENLSWLTTLLTRFK